MDASLHSQEHDSPPANTSVQLAIRTVEGYRDLDDPTTPRPGRRSSSRRASDLGTSSSSSYSSSSSATIGSDTETESRVTSSSSNMTPTRSSKHQSKKGKSKQPKTDDWSDVTEPEERRRIQNRIAQRKFREKAREQKERAERDARNQEFAGATYKIPEPEDMAQEDEAAGELSGLPWGSVNMRWWMTKAHETANSQQGSSQPQQGHSSSSLSDFRAVGSAGAASADDTSSSPHFLSPFSYPASQFGGGGGPGGSGGGWDSQGGSSGGDDVHHQYYEDPAAFYYDFEAGSDPTLGQHHHGAYEGA